MVSAVLTRLQTVRTANAEGTIFNPVMSGASISAPYGTGSSYTYTLESHDITKLINNTVTAVNMNNYFAAGAEGGICATINDTSTFVYIGLDEGAGGINLADRLLFFGFGGGTDTNALEYELWENGTRRVETGMYAQTGDIVCVRRTDSATEFWLNGEKYNTSNPNWSPTLTGSYYGRWALYNSSKQLDNLYAFGQRTLDKVNAKFYMGRGVIFGNNTRY